MNLLGLILVNLRVMPIRLHWSGWTSDTFSLERMKWTIYADEQLSMHSYEKQIRIAAKCPYDKMVITGVLSLPMHMRGGDRELFAILNNGVNMQHYKFTDKIITYPQVGSSFVDSMNKLESNNGLAYIPTMTEEIDFSSFRIFKQPSENGQSIYLPSGSVDDCLNRILELQYPIQKELKEKMAGMEAPIVRAKVYSIAA